MLPLPMVLAEWLKEMTEGTSVEKLKESCLKHVRPSSLRPSSTSASVLKTRNLDLCPRLRPSPQPSGCPDTPIST